MIEQWYSENRYITALVLKRFTLCVQTLPDCITASNDRWRLLDKSLLDLWLMDELTLWMNRLWTNRYWTNRYWKNCTRPGSKMGGSYCIRCCGIPDKALSPRPWCQGCSIRLKTGRGSNPDGSLVAASEPSGFVI